MGDPSDPIMNCVLEVCCGPEPARATFAAMLVDKKLCAEQDEADRIAAWVLTHFDLAPRGSLREFKAVIARIAKA